MKITFRGKIRMQYGDRMVIEVPKSVRHQYKAGEVVEVSTVGNQ